MHDVLHRLQSAERWLLADLAIRGIGCLLLGLCAAVAWWLYRSVHRLPAHPTSPAELAAGALAVVSWTTGWAALGEGQGLFKRVIVPGRHAPIDQPHRGKSHDRSAVARRARRAVSADAGLCLAVRRGVRRKR